LHSPGDYAAFASSIRALAQDRSRLAAMKRGARRFAELRLDETAMLDEYARQLA
jgi:hypothetical protein